MAEPAGTLLRALAGGDTVRLLVVDLPQVAERARVAHGLGPGAARLAAEGVVATALLAAHIKGEERLMLQLQGTHPRVAFVGEIDADGALRARLTPADLPVPEDDRLDGLLLAVKSDATREVYRGHTEVAGQRLEEALAWHLGASEQVDAILRIHARVGADDAVKVAGGLLLERLPEDPDLPSIDGEEFEARFGILREAPLDHVLAEIAGGGLLGTNLRLLEERPIVWRCRCSQHRVEATLASLGGEELRAVADEDHGAEVICHFCNTAYDVSEARLRELIEMLG